MYAIRVEPGRRRLAITCSERLTTAEAVRIVTHAAALTEADGLLTIVCDVRDVRRGPGSSLRIAAMAAMRIGPGQQVALLIRPDQVRAAQRFVRFTGRSNVIRAFTADGTMEHWLAGSREAIDSVRTPNGRHLELVTSTAAKHASRKTEDTQVAG